MATVLGKVIRKTGYELHQVVSRNSAEASRLAKLLGTTAASIAEISINADLYIIAVSDNQIAELANGLQLSGKIVVHTAGSVPMNVLQQTSENFGVIYPLQSLRKELVQIPSIPVLINGSNDYTTGAVADFAGKWAASVRLASDDERLKTHLAAVVASNFTNHLYALTEEYCNGESLDFRVLGPLITEIAGRLKQVSPTMVQTGPAARGDYATIEKHLELLSCYPALKVVYGSMTESIITSHHKLANSPKSS